MCFQHDGEFAGKGSAAQRLPIVSGCRGLFRSLAWVLIFASLVTNSTAVLARSKTKTDKFEGYVVVAGPKAITVKNKKNIYHVRTFNYSPKLEEKLRKKNLEPGKTVTVHYTRGTDVAVKLD